MNREQTHEMVGTLLDAVNKAREDGRVVVRIVMLGDAHGALLSDLSAKQFIRASAKGWEFCDIPVWSARAEGGRPFKLEYE